MTRWDDAQYLKFGDERTRAARELLARVPLADAERVVDLGCGPGNSTALLRERFPKARMVGVDNSPEMLARARRELPEVDFVDGDAAIFRASEPLDLLFANAVLHWVPDHATLFPRLLSNVRPGGVLAVQMPHNFSEPSHQLMREISADHDPAGTTSLARLRVVHEQTPVQAPELYYDKLAPLAQRVDVWETSYQHVMPDATAIVEWVKGTGLRPYLDALTAEERPRYLARYETALERAYPPRADGRRLFRFPRLFVVAVK